MMFRWLDKVLRGGVALAHPETDPDALYLLGETARRQGNFQEAIEFFRRAIAVRESQAAFHFGLGSSLQAEGRHREAAAACRDAVALDPVHSEAHELLGCALSSLRDRKRAIAAFDGALRINPEFVSAHCNRGLALLSLGDYARGWEEFEWRWQRPEYQTLRKLFSQAWWDGSDPDGRTILLFAEQGFGDAIQFIRYAPVLASRGARVVVDCHPPLQALFRQVYGVTRVLENDAEVARYALCCPLMSLPRFLGTRLESIPAEVPYLAAAADYAAKWRAKMTVARTFRVGLVWASNPGTGYAWHKSVPLEMFAPLARIEGVTFYSLQTGFPAQHAAQISSDLDLIDLSAGLHDFSDTAGLISNLDLVISVDTAVAHLAGAMGKTIWTLVPENADWRWGDEGEGSAWYPTMRLFRQQADGDWSGVVEQLGAALKERTTPQ